MLFNSPIYIFLFLPLVVIIYYFLNRFRYVFMGKIWLVLSSFFFYGYWNPNYIFLIAGSILFNYFVGTGLHQSGKQPGAVQNRLLKRKMILGLGVSSNLALLGYFKYTDFFIINVNNLVGTGFPALEIVLPLAISFFTFQQIAYLIDCYKSDTKEYDFINYCLFVSFFPQLIAGPIVHHSEMMPQFMNLKNRLCNFQNMSAGVYIFTIGLFKKVVIADSFAVWANTGFSDASALTFFDAWGTALSYSFQIYYDFSGYTDMAIGAALMFNIRLPINFNSPYKATNIRQFWLCWHITLSRWLRDYLYIPLGGNYGTRMRTAVNVLLTFLLGGLWHGAGWTFIIWGAMHGIAVVIHRFWRGTGFQLNLFGGWLCTFLFVTTSWVFFRADSLKDATDMLKGMAGLNGVAISTNFSQMVSRFVDLSGFYVASTDVIFMSTIVTLVYILVFGAVAFFLPNSNQSIGFLPYSGKFTFRSNYAFLGVSGVLLGISLITLFTENRPSEFLYFNF